MKIRALPALARRILSRLADAEALETNPWYQDDLRIARLTVAHAARGDAVLCSPDVLASYAVLGLHPEKVWPAILERRKALGPLEAVSDAPPKKPAQSVKLWTEKTNGVRAVNSHAAMQQGSWRTAISVPMASPSVTAYRNPDDSGSAKERPYFTVADIEKFFETCPPELLSRRFRHFLRHAWIAAGRPHGSNIELFTSAEKYRRACFYKSERTVRYNLRASEKLGYLEIVGEHHKWLRPRTARDRGLYRRVTTHRLSLSLLLRWRNGHHHSESAQAEPTPIRKPAAPAEKPLPPAPAAPQPARSKPAAVTSRQFTTLTRREVPKFVGVFVSLMKPRPIQESPEPEPPRNLALEAQWDRIRGLLEKKIDRHSFDTWLKPTRASEERNGVLYVRVPTVEFVHVGTKFAGQIAFALRELKLPYQGLQFFALEPRAPKLAPVMSKQDALVRTCQQFGISTEHGVEVLKLHGHKVEPEGGA